ncbi:response regulator transcription factor [Dechloromonas sp. XY25]|uniref:Response regulator transcription factor n=1 Tax=Dechloromonas hankyongensis TaxID=2908002 RepID=A0ABS9K029_9RHOO|nr:response regulator transcription factor [Dechloromonas hankyongensis]MCG2576471.1 response regulator transcription factor [Dechloromonas hankyongensis]
MSFDPPPPHDHAVTAASPRRVLVVDDHGRTLAAVAALLQAEYPRIDVVGTASDGPAALRLLAEAAPGIVVLDLDLGGERGLDLLPAIGRHPGVKVIILSSSDDPQEKVRALDAGAVAFIHKFAPAGELVGAVLAVAPQVPVGVLSCRAGSARPDKSVEASDSGKKPAA